jgi:hypothetical protein
MRKRMIFTNGGISSASSATRGSFDHAVRSISTIARKEGFPGLLVA